MLTVVLVLDHLSVRYIQERRQSTAQVQKWKTDRKCIANGRRCVHFYLHDSACKLEHHSSLTSFQIRINSMLF